ncbi:MAG: diacylglycerol/lipid kinase family protein [Bacillota bacterium]
MRKKVLLIYNERAGYFKIDYSRKMLCRLIEKKGYHVESVDTEKFAGVIYSLDSYSVLIVAGGDGSVNSVVEQLINHNVEKPPPLAVLPWGTANDLYRQLYNKGSDTGDVIDVIKNGNLCWLDIGQVNEHFFVNVVASGLFSDVSCLTPGVFKRLLGKTAYYLHALLRLFTYRPFVLHIAVNGEVLEEKVYLFLILNGSRVGGLFNPAPEAVLNDSKLHFLGIKKDLTPVQVLKILKCFLQGGTPELPGTINFTGKIMHLTYANNLPLVVDGEKGPKPPLEIKLIPARIPFFTNQI